LEGPDAEAPLEEATPSFNMNPRYVTLAAVAEVGPSSQLSLRRPPALVGLSTPAPHFHQALGPQALNRSVSRSDGCFFEGEVSPAQSRRPSKSEPLQISADSVELERALETWNWEVAEDDAIILDLEQDRRAMTNYCEL